MRFAIVLLSVLALSLVVTGPAMSQQHYVAYLSGANEVPANASPGTGLGCFTLQTTSVLDYDVAFSGLQGTENNAHIHGPAPAGQNAGVVFGFAPGSPKVGSFGPLTAQQVADLNAGLYYVNIHSTVFPGGELRGQIVSVAQPCTTPVEQSTWGAVKAVFGVE